MVEQQRGFEVGAGAGVLDEADAVAEVEAFVGDGLTAGVELLGRREQAAQAAAEIGGASEVGLGCGFCAAQGEDAGRGGDGAQESIGVRGTNSMRWSNWKDAEAALTGEIVVCGGGGVVYCGHGYDAYSGD